MSEIALSEWLESNGLSDMEEVLQSISMSVNGMKQLHEADLRNISQQIGLTKQQIDRLVNALNGKGPSTHSMVNQAMELKQNINDAQQNLNEMKSEMMQKMPMDSNININDIDDNIDDTPFGDCREGEDENSNNTMMKPIISNDDIDDDDVKYNDENNNTTTTLIPMDVDNDIDDDDNDDDDDDDEKKDDFDENDEVIPLIIPNNCVYDSNTKKLIINKNIEREKLVIYKPALQFISNIKCPIGTIVICGRTRTGKSLIAGELQSPGMVPCPFKLGHEMDACTYGIWIGIKPIYRNNKKECLLVLDVEGTGFHESTKQQDMQIMVISLLISSYFIYNTKGCFDSSALDEIEFVTELSEQIEVKPHDDKGDELNKFLPKFMWLLRDVHLEPTIDDQPVSVREYFTKKVLKFETGTRRTIRLRQEIRQIFLQMFKSYDAETLPMPHSDENVLQHLSTMDRNKLEPTFNSKLTTFCNKVIAETEIKNLYNGNDGFIQCTGHHLAEWLQRIIEIVNDPNKIPQISTMTQAVMAKVYETAKKNGIKQYNKLINEGMNTLRAQNQNGKQALNEKDIIETHLNVLNIVLSDDGDARNLQTTYHDKEQNEILFEFYKQIGHSKDITEIGKNGGIIYEILNENESVCRNECQQFIQQYYAKNIENLLNDPENNEFEDVLLKIKQFEDVYYDSNKGPLVSDIWNKFKDDNMSNMIQQFQKLKGFNKQIAEQEEKSSVQRQNGRNLKAFYEKQNQEIENQRDMMQKEIARIARLKNEEAMRYKKQMEEMKNKSKDMDDSDFNEMAKAYENQMKTMNNQIQNMQKENQKFMTDMCGTMQKTIQVIQTKQPPQMVDVVRVQQQRQTRRKKKKKIKMPMHKHNNGDDDETLECAIL